MYHHIITVERSKSFIYMNQEKIGKFIAELRKEKNMTQLDLAKKLGVTDRAISKWENGRGMPEISIIKPLCEELSITINELFCGEKIVETEFSEKAEENIVNTLEYTKTEIKKTKKIFSAVFVGVVGIIIILIICFIIDVNRMSNDKPIVFSTWGFDYFPPIDLKYEKIEYTIKEYLEKQGDIEEKHEEGVKTFIAFKTYLIEEAEDNQFNVYMWVLAEQCYLDKTDIKNYGSYSIPFKITVKKQERIDKYSVIESKYPRDGAYYVEDIDNLFPSSVIKEMKKLHKDGTFERMQLDIEEQVQLYFHKEYYPFRY